MTSPLKHNVSRRMRERAETRLRIVDAARDLFAAGGEEGLTLRRVAERIEYSATTIYLHFQSKEALVRELCAADFATFSRRLLQAERVADPLERLKKVASSYVDFGLQYPAQYRAMFIAVGSAETAAVPADTRAQRAVAVKDDKNATPAVENTKREPDPQDFLQLAVFKALAAGVFKAEYRDVPLLTQTLWAGLHGVISLHQVRAKHPAVAWRPIQSLTEMMIECVLNGMIVPALASAPGWRRGE